MTNASWSLPLAPPRRRLPELPPLWWRRAWPLANIVFPVASIYRWEGKTLEKEKWLLLIRPRGKGSTRWRKDNSSHLFRSEILCLPVLEGSLAYLEWMEESTRK